MPLTRKGSKIMTAMKKQHGSKKGEKIFHASRNKGTIKGVDRLRKRRLNTAAERSFFGRKVSA